MKDKLHAALKALGVETLTRGYSGYNDSGYMDDPTTSPYVNLDIPFEGDRSLSQAIEEYFYELLGAKHGGFENDDGGQGEFTWDIATNKIRLHHEENVIQQENYNYAF